MLCSSPPLCSGRFFGRSSPTPLDAESATDVGIEELEGLSQEGAGLGYPHQEQGHPNHFMDSSNDHKLVGFFFFYNQMRSSWNTACVFVDERRWKWGRGKT